MKFRRLTIEELQELETEFVQFLVSNTVTGDDWEKIKAETPDKAEGLIELFSDIVFEKIIKDIEYLEFKTPDDIKTFHCQEAKIVLNGLRMEGQADVDLTADLPPQELMKRVHDGGAKLQIYTAEKSYSPDRPQEIFRMLEGGALISRVGTLFNAIEGFKQQ